MVPHVMHGETEAQSDDLALAIVTHVSGAIAHIWVSFSNLHGQPTPFPGTKCVPGISARDKMQN